MTDHKCSGDVDTCRICASRLAALEARAEETDDHLADGRAADEFYGRERW